MPPRARRSQRRWRLRVRRFNSLFSLSETGSFRASPGRNPHVTDIASALPSSSCCTSRRRIASRSPVAVHHADVASSGGATSPSAAASTSPVAYRERARVGLQRPLVPSSGSKRIHARRPSLPTSAILDVQRVRLASLELRLVRAQLQPQRGLPLPVLCGTESPPAPADPPFACSRCREDGFVRSRQRQQRVPEPAEPRAECVSEPRGATSRTADSERLRRFVRASTATAAAAGSAAGWWIQQPLNVHPSSGRPEPERRWLLPAASPTPGTSRTSFA